MMQLSRLRLNFRNEKASSSRGLTGALSQYAHELSPSKGDGRRVLCRHYQNLTSVEVYEHSVVYMYE